MSDFQVLKSGMDYLLLPISDRAKTWSRGIDELEPPPHKRGQAYIVNHWTIETVVESLRGLGYTIRDG